MSSDNKKDIPSAVDDAAAIMAEGAAKDKKISKEEELKRKIEELRKRDPFVYR